MLARINRQFCLLEQQRSHLSAVYDWRYEGTHYLLVCEINDPLFKKCKMLSLATITMVTKVGYGFANGQLIR